MNNIKREPDLKEDGLNIKQIEKIEIKEENLESFERSHSKEDLLNTGNGSHEWQMKEDEISAKDDALRLNDYDMEISYLKPENSSLKQENTLDEEIGLMMPSTSEMNQELNCESGIDGKQVKNPLFDGKYFKIIWRNGNSVKCECVLCPNKTISACVNATTNLYTHLKRVHPGMKYTVMEYAAKQRSCNKRKLELYDKEDLVKSSSKILRQMTVEANFSMAKTHKVSQKEANAAIIAFIVKGLHSLAIVEQPEFIYLVQMLNPSVTVMSRRTLVHCIRESVSSLITRILSDLKGQKYLCTTADIWSTCHRNFLRVTIHWIDDKTLERRGAALACRRFEGTHSYKRIAEMLDDINTEFEISTSDIVSTVTDNGSNFVKAFAEFSVKIISIEVQENEEDDSIQEDFSEIDDDTFITPMNVSESECDDTDSHILLPNQVRCATHVLNLVVTTDIKQALKVKHFASLNHAAMSKCSALWNKAVHPKSAEIIYNILGCYLKNPCVTRWNSLYDSLSLLLKHRSEMNDLMTALKLPVFKSQELEYLEEYIITLSPIATAIGRLQGERHCFFGELIPTLLTVESQLGQLRVRTLKYCVPLLSAVTSGFKNRFSHYLNLDPAVNEAVLATVSHPYFKLRWLGIKKSWDVQAKRKEVQEMLVTLARNFAQESSDASYSSSSDERDDDEYFAFDRSMPNQQGEETPDVLVLKYLSDSDRKLTSLKKHSIIENIFRRYNTTLPSSAPVEQLFSFPGLVNSPRRERLSDKLFESLVLMKANM